MPTKKPLIGAAIVGQSGGPSSVINASAYGVIATALKNPNITRVLGAEHGIKGVLNDRLFDMGQEDPAELELLKYTPSSALGSCRYKMADPDVDDTDYKRILEIFKKYDVRYFFYNGGNDSMDTCNKISKYMQKVGYDCRVMGVPKTIDNDLALTDHTPGYGSAAKYIATSTKEVIRDGLGFSYKKQQVIIIEIMGRNAGWLTGAAALSRGEDCDGPDLIYLPERTFDIEKFTAKVRKLLTRKDVVVVAVSEGIRIQDGRYVSELGSASDYVDAFEAKYDVKALIKVTPKWDGGASPEEQLERILTQKWIACYPEGYEAWTEQRRTGYPQLFKVFVNNSGGAIDTDIRIRRLPYPSDIQKNNPTQYSALKKALGGEDNGGTRLWWDTGRNF